MIHELHQQRCEELPEEEVFPPFPWETLEEQLTAMAVTERQRGLVAPMISGMRKNAPFVSTNLLVRELLVLAWMVLEEELPGDVLPMGSLDPPIRRPRSGWARSA